MKIGPWHITLREPVKAASEPSPGFEERLDTLEEAVQRIADEFESVLDRINRWSARQAAQKRAQAIKNLEAMPDQAELEIVPPDANTGEAKPEQMGPKERAALKAALRRRAIGG